MKRLLITLAFMISGLSVVKGMQEKPQLRKELALKSIVITRRDENGEPTINKNGSWKITAHLVGELTTKYEFHKEDCKMFEYIYRIYSNGSDLFTQSLHGHQWDLNFLRTLLRERANQFQKIPSIQGLYICGGDCKDVW